MTATTLNGVLISGTAAARPAANAVAKGTVYWATDTGKQSQSDGVSTWTTIQPFDLSTFGPAGLADHGVFTYLDATGGSAPATPASGKARIYAKSDGRIYSKNDAGTEFGPFDAAGGGGGGGAIYDETFAAASDPAGWAFTGSGSRATPGGTIDVTGGAQSDRYLYTYSPASQFITIKAHVKNLTNLGGMPCIVAADSSGIGFGFGPYNDGNTYLWNVGSGYVYSSTGSGGLTTLGTTDLWLALMIAKGHGALAMDSLDGVTWRFNGLYNHASDLTLAKVGMAQVFNGGNSTYKLDEFMIFES